MSNQELINVRGGKILVGKWKYVGIIAGALISFVTGLIDGYLRPSKCK